MALDVTSKPADPSVGSVELEPTLLRGIPLHSCLSGTGHHWRRPRTTQSFTTSSQQTKQFDIFFSHDWGSSRLSKHLSLLMAFNGLPAAGACFAASLIMTLLETSHILPTSFWLPIFGHTVQLIVLFFWQYAWTCLRGPRMAFVDSSCIPQGDEVLKARCIQSLDQFLSKSKQLVALWSPQYFHRLWCSYELGFFLMKQKSAQTLHFVPVQIGLLCLLTFVGVTMIQAPLNIALYAFQLTWFQRVAVVCSSCVVQGAIVLPLQFFFWTNLLKELEELPQQLREFRVQDSQCTCCTLQHCHPVTKQPMPCDRELIYARIHSAFGRRLQESSALEAFNDYVRQTLASSVESNFRHHSMILRYTLLAAGAASWPYLPLHISEAIRLSAPGDYWLIFLFYLNFLYIDLAVFCLVPIFLLIGQFGVYRAGRSWRVVILCVQVAMAGLACCLLLLPGPIYRQYLHLRDERSWLHLAPTTAMLCLCICLAWLACGCASSSFEQTSNTCTETGGSSFKPPSDEENESCFEI